jgi:protein-S-isoprenylcysteine O-methyltransferase Ste14
MSGVDTGFLVLFLLLFGALSISSFIQARSNDKTKYENYFGLIYVVAMLALLVVGWNSMR